MIEANLANDLLELRIPMMSGTLTPSGKTAIVASTGGPVTTAVIHDESYVIVEVIAYVIPDETERQGAARAAIARMEGRIK